MSDRNISININAGTLFKTGVFVLLAVLAYRLSGLILVILAAVVFASVIEPGTKWLVKRKMPRALAVIGMYLFILGILASLFFFVIPPLLSEMANALNSVPKYIQTIDLFKPVNGSFSGVRSIFPDIPTSISVGDIITSVSSSISGFSGGFFDTISNFLGGLVSLTLIIVVSFYLSVREDGVAEFLRIVTPLKHEKYVIGLWKRSQDKIGKWMQGQLLLGLIVGILSYLGLIILNVRHPLLLAFLAAVFELIPIVGMSLAGIPAFLIGTFDNGIGLGLLVAGLYLIIQQFEANLIYPLVVKKIVGVPPLLVILALVAGAELAGLLGALLAVPISVALMEFIEDVEKRKRFVIEPAD